MSLKTAKATITKETGESVERVFSIRKVIFHFDEMRVEVIYEAYPPGASKEIGAVPDLFSQSIPVDMSNEEDAAIILSASGRIWRMCVDVPFIKNYEPDKNGRLEMKIRSFEDLNAEITGVKE